MSEDYAKHFAGGYDRAVRLLEDLIAERQETARLRDLLMQRDALIAKVGDEMKRLRHALADALGKEIQDLDLWSLTFRTPSIA